MSRTRKDVAQQVFVRVWRSAARYQPSAKFTTWLFTITRNLVFNEIRRKQRKPTVSLEEREEEHFSVTSIDGEMKPDESALHAELEVAVEAAIQRLPEKQRLAVVLRRYQELPYEEIGEILGLSPAGREKRSLPGAGPVKGGFAEISGRLSCACGWLC